MYGLVAGPHDLCQIDQAFMAAPPAAHLEQFTAASNRIGDPGRRLTPGGTELSPKRLELLKEAVPNAVRVVFLSDPDDAPPGLKLTQDAAPRLGIKLHVTDVQAADRLQT